MGASRVLLTTVLLAVSSIAATAGGRTLAERVSDAARSEAMAAVSAPDRFEVSSSRFAGADPMDDDRVDLIPIDVDGPNLSGIVRVTFRMSVNGRPVGVARGTVRGRVMGPALQSNETLRYGETISTQAVHVVESDLTRLDVQPLRSADDLEGRAAGRTLGAGRILTAELLRPPTAVRRGETASIQVLREGLRLTLRANVLKDGAAGDRVPVRNLSTGARMVAEVWADGSLRLVEHAGRPR